MRAQLRADLAFPDTLFRDLRADLPLDPVEHLAGPPRITHFAVELHFAHRPDFRKAHAVG